MNDDMNETMKKSDATHPTEENTIHGSPAPLSILLKAPGILIRQIDRDESLPIMAVQMLLWGLAFHAVYGFAMALFGSFPVAAMTLWKAPLIAFCSLLLCMPSLYVFSCVAGMPVTIAQAFALASTTMAMTGLLLLGLTPVTWLFSVSTNNLAFVVAMNVIAWSIAVGFSLRFFGALSLSEHLNKTTGLKWWVLVYIVVSLQMATTMRPLLVKPAAGWRDSEKKFFLAHFKESVAKEQKKDVLPSDRK